jgi:asparagine synthase (glutamine-hydrolysing)
MSLHDQPGTAEARLHVTQPAVHASAKELLSPNVGKPLTVMLDGESWARIPLRTELFDRGDDLAAKLARVLRTAVEAGLADPDLQHGFGSRWYVLVVGKVVAITQGRSFFTWEIQPGLAARLLSKFVMRTPHGLGLGSPWAMQLAIDEAGLPRVLGASLIGLIGKLIRRRGWFYRVAGHHVNDINGPTEYSAYPSNVSAKMAPKDPERVATELRRTIQRSLPADARPTFGGVALVDANDLGRQVLGQDTDRPNAFFDALVADNPMGQGRQLTPVALALRVG